MIVNVLTARISRASVTWVQSRSTILNEDHGICFTRRLLRRTDVMGPYISSADATNNPIGCVNVWINDKWIKDYLPDEVCLLGSTFWKPFPIVCCYAMGFSGAWWFHNVSGYCESTRFVVQMLGSKEGSLKSDTKDRFKPHLDRKSPDCSDDIQRST